MPTYDYICNNCGYEFEEFHSMSADPVNLCPKCGHLSVERKISGGSGLIFKGSGFYITDYAKKKSSPKSENIKADKKSDNKPKTKPADTPKKSTESKKN